MVRYPNTNLIGAHNLKMYKLIVIFVAVKWAYVQSYNFRVRYNNTRRD